MQTCIATLDPDGLRRFDSARAEAVDAVGKRIGAELGPNHESFGPQGHDAWREEIAFDLDFLRPVLEFGSLQPMVDYLRWLERVLAARAIPADHVPLCLDWLADFYAKRFPGCTGETVAAALHAARDRMGAGNEPGTPVVAPRREPWPQCEAFETALRAGDHRTAGAIVNRLLDDGCSLVGVELHVIQPALYRIGEQWQANQVSVAQEHLATAIVHSVMTMGLLRSRAAAPAGRKVLLACVEGNHHCVGLRMVADAFLLAGWDVQYLGANVPTRSLVSQVAAWKPHLVGLSVSFPQQLRVVREAVDLIASALPRERPAVLLGGLAINQFDGLAAQVGADAWSFDALSAVDRGTELVGAGAMP